jgi:hypothetical protein
MSALCQKQILAHDVHFTDFARPSIGAYVDKVLVRYTKTLSLMSALGQKQTFRSVRAMSALPPKADMDHHGRDVRFVPIGDIATGMPHLLGLLHSHFNDDFSALVAKAPPASRYSPKSAARRGSPALMGRAAAPGLLVIGFSIRDMACKRRLARSSPRGSSLRTRNTARG